MRIKTVALTLSGLFCFTSMAHADVASDYAQEAQYAAQLAPLTGQSLAIYPGSSIPGYTDNPAETTYYNNPQGIQPASGATLAGSTPAANAGNDSNTNFTSGPNETIDMTSPAMQQPLLAQSDAYDVANGISDQYVNCQNKTQCSMQYVNKTCQVERQINLTCTNTLNATVNYQPYPFDCNHVVTGSNMQYTEEPGPDSSGNCVTGFMQVFTNVSGNYQNSGNVQATLPPGVSGHIFMTLRGLDYNHDFNPATDQLSLQETGNGVASASIVTPPFADPNVLWGTTTANFSTPSSSTPVNVSYNWTLIAKGKTEYTNHINGIQPAVIYIEYPSTTFNVPNTTLGWVNSCQNDNFLGQCTQTSSTCTDNSGTKTINGAPVTEPCWQYTLQYQCGQNQNSCGSSISGCDELGSTCANPSPNGLCLNYNVTYQCAQNVCTPNGAMCGTPTFCQDGSCSPVTPTTSSDFGQSEAEVAAAAAAANQLAGGMNVQAFTGTPADCSEAAIGIYNCCANSGWGINMHLASCTQAEKSLGQDRENNLAVFVGTYCYKSVLGVCVDTHEQYCTWVHGEAQPAVGDLLAYDIQTQGRQKQLGIGFGSGSSPDCSGLTVQQLQGINFNAIDFGNVTADLSNQATLPQTGASQAAIEQHVQQEMPQ